MGEIYNLHQHSRCVTIYLGKTHITFGINFTSNRAFKNTSYEGTNETSIIYDQSKSKILYWGGILPFYLGQPDTIIVENFYDKIYYLFKKDSDTWDEEDQFTLKAISDFMLLKAKNMTEDNAMSVESFDVLHYVFVVPSEWETEIQEKMIRPIFIQSGLLSRDDHPDRLIFLSDLESIFYYTQNSTIAIKRGPTKLFMGRQNILMVRLTPVYNNVVSVALDLIEAQRSLFGLSESVFFPRVMQSDGLLVKTDDLITRLKEYLVKNLFPQKNYNANEHNVVDIVLNYIYNRIEHIMDEYNEDESKRYIGLNVPFIKDTDEWELNELQTEFLKTISIFDLCAELSEGILETIKNLLVNNVKEKCSCFLIANEYTNQKHLDPLLFSWLQAILEYTTFSLSYIITVPENKSEIAIFDTDQILKGAGVYAFEVIQNADIYASPCILPYEVPTSSSSVFINAAPNALIHIDILFDSTLISYSSLTDDGVIDDIIEHSYFTKNIGLPPLGLFYNFRKAVTLNIDKQFISITEKYLSNDLNCIALHEPSAKKLKEMSLEFEAVINTSTFASKENVISTQQNKYILSFLLMYFVYIDNIISSKLSNEKKNVNIGYVISIEKKLLDTVIGTKENLKQMIFESGMVKKNESSKKLKIITQAEGVLANIQRSLKLELPIKSCVVLVKIHPDYLLFTLNQIIVTASSKNQEEEEEEESIVLQDEVISIQNIYESICLNMWNHLIDNPQFIQRCDVHTGVNLFSLEPKKEFSNIFKSQILHHIFSRDSDLQHEEKIRIQLTSCTCEMYLSISDIINIAIEPVLDDLVACISGTLINTALFGKYTNILYLFGLLYFNHNPQLQIILGTLLNEKFEDFNGEREMETSCLILPEFIKDIPQPVIHQPAVMYRGFKRGDLHRVCCENYAFYMRQNMGGDTAQVINPLYKSKKTDSDGIECENLGIPLLKKGDRISSAGKDTIIYVTKQTDSIEEHVTLAIVFPTSELFDGFRPDERIVKNETLFEVIEYFYLDFEGFGKGSDLPIMISMRPKEYSSSLEFSVRILGQDVENNEEESNYVRVGDPMTLKRF